MRLHRLLCLSSTLSLASIGILACSDDSVGAEGSAETSGDSDSDSGDGDGDSSSGDGDGDATDSNAGDGDGDATDSNSGDGDGDGDGDASGDGDGDASGDGDGDSGLSVVMLNNSRVIARAEKGGELTAECVLFEAGLPAAEQPVFDYSVAPAEGVVDNGGSWSFDDFGSWTASCEATVGNVAVSAEQDIAVINGAIDKRALALGEGVSASYAAIVAVLAANEGEDQALIDAISELEAVGPALAAPELDIAGLDRILLPIPHGYPTTNELDNGGVMANADDDAYLATLADANAAFDELLAFYAGLDPMLDPTQEDLDALTAAGAEFDAALEAFAALEPTAHSAIAHHEQVAAAIRDHMLPALEAVNGYVVTRAQTEAELLFGIKPPGPDLAPKFGLLGLTLGMFNQSNIRIRLINEWYGDALDAIDKSINNLILNDLLNQYFPASPDGPYIDFYVGSASQGFSLPGYDWWIYGGNFNSDPNYNLVLVFGDNWQGIVDNILNACGVSAENSAPENYEAMEKCIEDTQDAVDSILNTPLEVIEPGFLGEQDVHLGPFPDACGGFLPVATIVIPINYAVGRGESWLTNCLP